MGKEKQQESMPRLVKFALIAMTLLVIVTWITMALGGDERVVTALMVVTLVPLGIMVWAPHRGYPGLACYVEVLTEEERRSLMRWTGQNLLPGKWDGWAAVKKRVKQEKRAERLKRPRKKASGTLEARAANASPNRK